MNLQQDVEPHSPELEQLKNYARTYGRTVMLSLSILLVGVIGIRLYRARKQSAVREASALLTTARSVQELEALVSEYKSAPSATLAKLRLAKSYFDAVNYDLALETYRDIKEQDSAHPLAAAADLGIAHCLEAKGQPQEALREFEEFLENSPDHFLAAQAVFGKARCLDQVYRTADARAVIEDFIVASPDSRWLAPAEELLEILGEKME